MFRFPWTNTHELNLDWLIRTVKWIEKKMSNVVTSINGSTGDVVIPIPSPFNGTPAALGNASPGTSENYARGDHVHPKQTLELLWTNPQLDEDFPDTTIDIDLSNYQYVRIVFADQIACIDIAKNHTAQALRSWQFDVSGTPYFFIRRCIVSNSSIRITNCSRKQINASGAPSTQNSYLKPEFIYGYDV